MAEFVLISFAFLALLGIYVVLKLPQFHSIEKLMNKADKYISKYEEKFPYLSSDKCPDCGSSFAFRKGVEGYFHDCTNPKCFFIKKWGLTGWSGY